MSPRDGVSSKAVSVRIPSPGLEYRLKTCSVGAYITIK